MPKVNLYPLPNPDGTDADTRVEVGWTPHGGGSVQLATTKVQPGAEEFRHREYFGGTDPEEPRRPVWNGWYIDLDRDQINNLIQRLREARDAAYGRDQ